MILCSKCGQSKAKEAFYERDHQRSRSRCIECSRSAAVEKARRRRRGEPPSAAKPPPPLELTAEAVGRVLSYDAATGIFRWKITRGAVLGGAEAGTINANGYRVVTLWRESVYAHRLAWLMAHGVWPTQQINHINGIKTDNRIANLEDVSHRENAQHAYRTGLKPRVAQWNRQQALAKQERLRDGGGR